MKSKISSKGKSTRSPAGIPAIKIARRRAELGVKTEVLEQSIAYMLRRAQLSSFQSFMSIMKDYDVRPINYAVLVLIRANPGQSQIALASALGIGKNNFVMVLDGLEERGLTERRKDPADRRTAALYLTKAGDTFVRRLETVHLTLESAIKKKLGERNRGVLLKLLHDLCAASEVLE